MSRFRRSPILPVALIGLTLLGTASAAPVPTPVIPPIGAIPGAQTARFKVVVEGAATAAKDFAGGSTAPCVISLQGRVQETTTYRRGKNVVMEFTRVGAVVLVHRKGRLTDASLNLKVRTTRTASGSASRTDVPGAPVTICPALNEDLSQGAECGTPQVVNVRAGLLYEKGHLRLALNGADGLGFTAPDCPTSQIVDGLDGLRFGWPEPPAAGQMRVFIPPAQIFGTAKVKPPRVIVRTFQVRPTPRRVGPQTFTLPGDIVRLTATDFGTNRLTIRLIRVR